MAISDYASLKTAVAAWLNRDDDEMVDRIPEFIALAESTLSKKLRVLDMRKTATLAQVGGVFVLPAGVVEIVNIATQNNPTVALEPITAAYVDYAAGSRQGGLPIYYSLDGDGIRVFPVATGPLTLTYYQQIPALSGTNPTNWLLQRSPEAYLYATLMEAVPFADAGPERANMWGPMASDAIDDLMRVNSMMVHSGQRMRLKGPTP